jgi:mRNA-degrading endonuclease RelE of RelBE toxin-antitoxin system
LKYEVRLPKRANRELFSLEESTRSRIAERLKELRDDLKCLETSYLFQKDSIVDHDLR